MNRQAKLQDEIDTQNAWDLDSQLFLRQFNCKYNKVASAMLTAFPLLEMIAEEGKYTFISTGMHELEEIDQVVEVFRRASCPFEIMHCNSQYPMPTEMANLRVMDTLKKRYNCDIGYSGHEAGLITLNQVEQTCTSKEIKTEEFWKEQFENINMEDK